MIDTVKFQLSLCAVLCLVWVIQIFAVFPLESRLLDPSIVSVASVLFLPSGVKVIFATVIGYRALVPIVVGTVFGMWLHTGDLLFSVQFSILSSIALYIPVFILKALQKVSSDTDSSSTINDPLSLSRDVLVISVVASLFNSWFGSFIYGNSESAWLHFLVGDLMGATCVLAILITVRRSLFRLIVRHIAPRA